MKKPVSSYFDLATSLKTIHWAGRLNALAALRPQNRDAHAEVKVRRVLDLLARLSDATVDDVREDFYIKYLFI